MNKESTPTRILRVACPDRETHLEIEVEVLYAHCGVYIQDKASIKVDSHHFDVD